MISELQNAQGETLDFRFHEASSPKREKHVVVIGHGVTANLDRPWAKTLADSLAAAGFHALRFSFSGNGESGGDFRDCCVSKEVADLGSVIDALAAAGATVSYVGHSMGGAVGAIRTANDKRIEHFVALAPMVETGRFAKEEFGEETPDSGFMWEDDECPLSSTFMDDLTGIGSVLDQFGEIDQPVLIVHGADDDLVPVSEAQAAEEKGPKLVVLEGVNHVFSDAEEQMAGAVIGWLSTVVS